MSTFLDRFMSSYNATPGTSAEDVAKQRAYYDSKLNSVSSPDSGSFANNLSQLLDTMNKTNSVSALQASLAAARETNSFNARQAEINRLFQQNSAQAAMDFEAAQNQKAMDFSERMANTTYQRAIEDLKAAGLSPLLAYGNLQTSSPVGSAGSGVSSSGSSASGVKADTSSALSVERKPLEQLLAMITLNVNSALQISNQGIKLVDALIPG